MSAQGSYAVPRGGSASSAHGLTRLPDQEMSAGRAAPDWSPVGSIGRWPILPKSAALSSTSASPRAGRAQPAPPSPRSPRLRVNLPKPQAVTRCRTGTCDYFRENVNKCIDFRPRPMLGSGHGYWTKISYAAVGYWLFALGRTRKGRRPKTECRTRSAEPLIPHPIGPSFANSAPLREPSPFPTGLARGYDMLRADTFSNAFCRPSSPAHPARRGSPGTDGAPPLRWSLVAAKTAERRSPCPNRLTDSRDPTGAAMHEPARSCNVFRGSENAFRCNRFLFPGEATDH